MVTISSWDDGGLYDLRLAVLLNKYDIPGIFYIPSCCELSPSEIVQIYGMEFEIGGHTHTHPKDLKTLKLVDQIREIDWNKTWLECVIGDGTGEYKITKFAYPRGKYNDITVEVLKEFGFKEARTTVTGCIEEPIDKFRIKTSVHVYPETPRFNKPNWFKEAIRLYDEAKRTDGRFEIWGHSWEIEKFNQWEELEKFFKYIKK